MRTGQQARHVIARHVLHDLAAEREDAAFRIQQLRAQDKVLERAGAHAARA
jgi:hypothetical protein